MICPDNLVAVAKFRLRQHMPRRGRASGTIRVASRLSWTARFDLHLDPDRVWFAPPGTPPGASRHRRLMTLMAPFLSRNAASMSSTRETPLSLICSSRSRDPRLNLRATGQSTLPSLIS